LVLFNFRAKIVKKFEVEGWNEKSIEMLVFCMKIKFINLSMVVLISPKK